jgi:hypothetical protein
MLPLDGSVFISGERVNDYFSWQPRCVSYFDKPVLSEAEGLSTNGLLHLHIVET